MVVYARCEVFGGCCDLLVRQSFEDIRDNLVERQLIVRLQLVLVLPLQLLLSEVQIQRSLLVLLELHYDERVPSLALSERWVEPDAEHEMKFVRLGQYHELLDGFELDLVVIRLAAQTEGSVEHVDIETSSALRLVWEEQQDEHGRRAWQRSMAEELGRGVG